MDDFLDKQRRDREQAEALEAINRRGAEIEAANKADMDRMLAQDQEQQQQAAADAQAHTNAFFQQLHEDDLAHDSQQSQPQFEYASIPISTGGKGSSPGIILVVSLLTFVVVCSALAFITTPNLKNAHSPMQAIDMVIAEFTGDPSNAPSVTSTYQDSQDQNIWNQDKANSLVSFMESWETQMGRSYQYADSTNDVKYYDRLFPLYLEIGSLDFTFNNQSISPVWYETADETDEYQIDGIFSDQEDNGTHHLYFFVNHNGKPIVMVTDQNPSDSGNALNFSKTIHTDLLDKYAELLSK